jgi:hypothetical protein
MAIDMSNQEKTDDEFVGLEIGARHRVHGEREKIKKIIRQDLQDQQDGRLKLTV